MLRQETSYEPVKTEGPRDIYRDDFPHRARPYAPCSSSRASIWCHPGNAPLPKFVSPGEIIRRSSLG
jgi:hypothetical protein